jgi:hypothetical protein
MMLLVVDVFFLWIAPPITADRSGLGLGRGNITQFDIYTVSIDFLESGI